MSAQASSADGSKLEQREDDRHGREEVQEGPENEALTAKASGEPGFHFGLEIHTPQKRPNLLCSLPVVLWFVFPLSCFRKLPQQGQKQGHCLKRLLFEGCKGT